MGHGLRAEERTGCPPSPSHPEIVIGGVGRFVTMRGAFVPWWLSRTDGGRRAARARTPGPQAAGLRPASRGTAQRRGGAGPPPVRGGEGQRNSEPLVERLCYDAVVGLFRLLGCWL